ncbi:MAG TPA: hypothetical protein VNA22_06795, partial [Pyrinomonadaceae bacterium]|nr:hypothetical protein [Pyrinomonadaceae bacterium]
YMAIPEVPKQTLSAILRGRVEEITGWALYQQNNFPEAVVRLRRAISVMPDKSAWWRSSMWRLGAALAADGKDSEALNSYIESYKTDKPDFAKYAVVEALYKKVNGSLDGLEAKLGPERVLAGPGATEVAAAPIVSPAPETNSTSAPASVAPDAVGVPKSEGTKPETRVDVSKPDTPKLDTPRDQPKPEPAKTDPEKPAEKQIAVVTETRSKPEESKPVPSEPAVEKALSQEQKDVSVRATDPIKDKPVAKVDDPKPGASDEKRATAGTAKPLFEPIVITVPNSRPAKSDKPAGEASGAARTRVIDGEEVKTEDVPPCTIGVSQDHLSLINGGGTAGILVSLEAPGDIKTMTATASSPKDISVTLEPEIAGMADRRFYVLKSLTSALGVYQVSFAAPCGKKDVVITVR